MSDMTQILNAIEQGDPHAAEQLLPLVYDELRKLAAQKLAQESPGQTLQGTALLHEAYLRLVDTEKAQHWDSRRHFFAAAAEAMRRILVDNARHKQSQKRGGGAIRHDLDEISVAAPQMPEEILALNEALEKLAEVDQPAAELCPPSMKKLPVAMLASRPKRSVLRTPAFSSRSTCSNSGWNLSKSAQGVRSAISSAARFSTLERTWRSTVMSL